MTATRTEIPPNEPIIIMSRLYDAPQDLLWRVMTDPAHVAKWWGGEGVTNPRCEMDLRPGGDWHHVMRFPDGYELAIHFVFVAVEPPHRLVWKNHDFGIRREGPPTSEITLKLEPEGKGTRWTMIARFISLADRDAAVSHGFTGPIEASNEFLVAYLKEIAR